MRQTIYLLFMFLVGCSWLEDDPGQEENPVEVIGVLLPQAQTGLARAAGGEYAVYAALFTQQLAGLDGEILEIDRYNIYPEHTDKSWKGFYLNVFSHLSKIIRVSGEAELYKARGIARIMTAHALGLVSSSWGDIPFSESFLADEPGLQPAYDFQETIYELLFSLLEEGTADLLQAGDQNFPSGHDILFGGDPVKWTRLANFIKLRYRLHLTGRTGYSGMTGIAGEDIFAGPGESYGIDFSLLDDFVHPVHEILVSSPGSILAGEALVEMMKSSGDPRLSAYFTPADNGEFIGSGAGEGNGSAAGPGPAFVSSGSAVILASYTEQKFIEAEIFLMNNMPAGAALAFNDALFSSLYDHGITDSGWYEENLAGEDLSLEEIINAKYIALFFQPEAWSDWRRTGYPWLEPAAGNSTEDLIPRRLPYPASEYLHNSHNVPGGVVITMPVWWDNRSFY